MTNNLTSHAIYVRTNMTSTTQKPFGDNRTPSIPSTQGSSLSTPKCALSVDELSGIEPLSQNNMAALHARQRLHEAISQHPDGQSSQNAPLIIRRDGSKYSLRTILKLWGTNTMSSHVPPPALLTAESLTGSTSTTATQSTAETCANADLSANATAQDTGDPCASTLTSLITNAQQAEEPSPQYLHTTDLSSPSSSKRATDELLGQMTPPEREQDAGRMDITPNKGHKRCREHNEESPTTSGMTSKPAASKPEPPVFRIAKRGISAYMNTPECVQCIRDTGNCTCPKCHPSPPAKTQISGAAKAPNPTSTISLSKTKGSGLLGGGGQSIRTRYCGQATRCKSHSHIAHPYSTPEPEVFSILQSSPSTPSALASLDSLPLSAFCHMSDRAFTPAQPSGERSGRGRLTVHSSGPCSKNLLSMCCNGCCLGFLHEEKHTPQDDSQLFLHSI